MTIEALFIAGALVGFLIGVAAPSRRVGCNALWIVPAGMFAYIASWQWLHPENIRSTSGLDFVFGVLPPSLGAAAGFLAGITARFAYRAVLSWFHRRKRSGI